MLRVTVASHSISSQDSEISAEQSFGSVQEGRMDLTHPVTIHTCLLQSLHSFATCAAEISVLGREQWYSHEELMNSDILTHKLSLALEARIALSPQFTNAKRRGHQCWQDPGKPPSLQSRRRAGVRQGKVHEDIRSGVAEVANLGLTERSGSEQSHLQSIYVKEVACEN